MGSNKLKTNKGVAGLEILISLIATLFVCGILVMAFVLTGSKIRDSVDNEYGSVGNNTYFQQYYTSARFMGYRDITNSTFRVFNYTGTNILNAGVHYHLNPQTGYLTFTTTGYGLVNDSNGLRYNVTFNYLIETEAKQSLNETTLAISEVTDWFSTFITIGAIVVLVLLIVLVIMAIRRAGLMGGGGVGA